MKRVLCLKSGGQVGGEECLRFTDTQSGQEVHFTKGKDHLKKNVRQLQGRVDAAKQVSEKDTISKDSTLEPVEG